MYNWEASLDWRPCCVYEGSPPEREALCELYSDTDGSPITTEALCSRTWKADFAEGPPHKCTHALRQVHTARMLLVEEKWIKQQAPGLLKVDQERKPDDAGGHVTFWWDLCVARCRLVNMYTLRVDKP